jgi:hypothetical protein
MKKANFITAFVLIALFFSTWSTPALAGAKEGAKLVIDNKTGAALTVELSGPRSYTLTAAPGKSQNPVEAGKYRYSYKACGATKTGSITISAKGGKLAIPKCVMAGVTIVNDTGSTLYINLNGPATFNFTVGTGKTKVSVIKGKYNYSVSGACGSKSGVMNLKKGDVWTWWCY